MFSVGVGNLSHVSVCICLWVKISIKCRVLGFMLWSLSLLDTQAGSTLSDVIDFHPYSRLTNGKLETSTPIPPLSPYRGTLLYFYRCGRGGNTCTCGGSESSCTEEERSVGGEHMCGDICEDGRMFSARRSGQTNAVLVQRELIPLNILSPPRQAALPRLPSRKKASSFTASARRRQDLYD